MASMKEWVKAREKRLPGKARNSSQAKARLLMTEAYYFVVHGGLGNEPTKHKDRETQKEKLAEIAGRMKLLAVQIRPMAPNDSAWRYYDDSMTHFWAQVESGRGYAANALHYAGEALNGAASRLPLH
jgi:Ser/Thr protein kinase RdoA (MazF antagonist)